MNFCIVDSGTYVLWITTPRRVIVEAGALGRVSLAGGAHLYVGSARRTMAARVVRHLSRCAGVPQTLRARSLARLGVAAPAAKKVRWHIDHLLEHPAARVHRVSLLPGAHCECDLVQALRDAGAVVAAPGFGASDCRRRCGAHLLRMPRGTLRQARVVVSAAGEVRELV